jgi:hypothetical protein
MTKKDRIGSDPLSWIKDTRGEREESKQDKPSRKGKQSIKSAPSTQSTKSTQSVPSIQKTPQEKKGAREGLPPGWIRNTFIIREDYLEKLKDLAWWERKQLKELVDEILGSYLKDKKIKVRERIRGGKL